MNARERPDVELLADLDAGVLDAERARAVRAHAAADPASARVLDALAATRAELRALPSMQVPPDVLARWTDSVGGESVDVMYITDLSRIGERRIRLVLVAAVAAVLAGAVGIGIADVPTDPGPHGDPVGLAAEGTAAAGTLDIGPLTEPRRLSGCLRAAGLPDATVIGGRAVLIGERPGILLVLATDEQGRFRLVVVDPACGPGGADVLADTTVGR